MFRVHHLVWRTVQVPLGCAKVCGILAVSMFTLSGVVAPAVAQQPASAAIGAEGLWIDHTGRGAIEIKACPTGLCGQIVWMQDPNDKQGRPLVDGLNEDRRMRVRPICGLQIIGGLKLQSDGSWDRGWIYDPEQGESFDVELRLRSAEKLQVKGYKGLKFLSETYQWTRAAEPPGPRCAA